MAVAKKTAAAKPAASKTSGPAPGSRPLELGMTGPDVEVLQGAVGAEVDGTFGVHTERAVKVYQRTHSLLMTGRVDAATWKRALRDLEA